MATKKAGGSSRKGRDTWESLVVTTTSGFSLRLRNQAGWVSSPPLEATITITSPSRCGDVNMTDLGLPDFRPTVVNSSTGMLAAVHPNRPPLTFRRPRCSLFIVRSWLSLGTGRA